MRPEPRLVVALAAAFVPALVSAFWKPLGGAALALIGAIVLLAVFDALAARRLPAVRVARVVPGALSLGCWTVVRLELESDATAQLDIELYDHHPPVGQARGLPSRVVVACRFGDSVRLDQRLDAAILCPPRIGAVSAGQCQHNWCLPFNACFDDRHVALGNAAFRHDQVGKGISIESITSTDDEDQIG